MRKLVLLRHGESTWNKENRFTGWTDVDLSDQGRRGGAGGRRGCSKAEGYTFDVAYTSVLKRAIRTLWIVLDEMDLMWIPVHRTWRLNERHYGALQGLNKAETAAKYGEEQVQDLAPQLRHRRRPPLDAGRPALSAATTRATPDLEPGRAARAPSASRTPSRASCPTGTTTIAPADPGGQAGAHRRPRQQPAGAGQVPRQHLRRGDRRAQHPHRHPAGLRAGRRPASRSSTTTWATRRRRRRRPKRWRSRRRGGRRVEPFPTPPAPTAPRAAPSPGWTSRSAR